MDGENKVSYGLKNVRYAILYETDDGRVFYGVPAALPGAVSISLPANAFKRSHAADNCEYWTAQVSGTLEGDLNLALIPDAFRADCLAERVDAASGVRYETDALHRSRFALLFEFSGDAKKTRHVLYNCSASRPAAVSTSVDPDSGPDPSPQTLTIAARVRRDNLLKACARPGDPPYERWFDAVFVPAHFIRLQITPPVKLSYEFGDAFDSSGFSVTLSDDNGAITDITAQCSLILPDDATLKNGDLLLKESVSLQVSVMWNDTIIGAFYLAISAVDGGWWSLNDRGELRIYCNGNMDDYMNPYYAPWRQGRRVKIPNRTKLIKSVVISEQTTSIANTAFCYCENLESVTILSVKFTHVGYSAFHYCYKLENVSIPDGAKQILDYAFAFCSSLTSVTIPEGVTKIWDNAFNGCRSLANIVIPDSVTEIQQEAFIGCSGLKSVIIPDSVTEIQYGTFEGCRSLESVTIPDSVTSIGGHAFKSCGSLTNIAIPDSVTYIGSAAFESCGSLTNIEIPDGADVCNGYTFHNCYNLTSIVIPEGVTSIGYRDFSGCGRLTSVIIPDSVTSIGEDAFDTTGLENITIPKSVTSIMNGAFSSTKLTSVKINQNCVLGTNAFPSGCVISYYEDEEAGT